MSDVCEDKNHSGRNSLMAIKRMVRGWKNQGQISDQDHLLFLVQFDRLRICTKLFGKPHDQIKEENNES